MAELKVAKEFDDCLAALLVLAEAVKAKKPVSEIVASSLPAFIAAVEGFDKVPLEAKEDRKAFFATAGYRVGELVDLFLPKQEVVLPPELPPAA